MILTKATRVSVVIPVYNEADHLAACLRALACQTVLPYEVIVVDNNSTDGSRDIAERFDFVTIVSELRQGVVHARSRGFDAATGDIIGRIDADTVLSADWTATVIELFDDQSLDAVSGAVIYHDLPWKSFLGWLDLSFRQWIANGMHREVFLFGSNMAVRRQAWQRVRTSVCASGGQHEDFDLAIHLHDNGAKVTFNRRLEAAVSLRRFNTGFGEYWRYVWLSPSTYSQHRRRSHFRMYPVVALVVCNYWLIKLLYKTYNLRNGALPLRVNPATYVD
ncbi:MAG: glycosyltransferase family 2 protein [Candidatus Saccharimonadales bacterium]